MRLFKSLCVAALAFMPVFASADSQSEKIADPNQGQLINFEVDYSITEYPNLSKTGVLQVTNGDTINLIYTVVNHEDHVVSVVGHGGFMNGAVDPTIQVNLTAEAVGPYQLEKGETINFVQKIPIDFDATSYQLSPEIYLVMNQEIKRLPVRQQLTLVEDVTISNRDPQLIFLVTILVGIASIVIYGVYSYFVKAYLHGTAPVYTKPVITKKKSKHTKPEFDSSWVPEAHLKKTSRTRKAH
ncbi:increased recombination centers protein 22 [[Candida] anglica]|uniref:Increased recombination centers protein 22 n=1 Tax=[Candida] anglica TaxID=148631 RepID=A0ABP0E810_9ASCO